MDTTQGQQVVTKQPVAEVPMLGIGSTLSGVELEAQISSIPMNKDNAIKMIALISLLDKRKDEAKDYLMNRCGTCDSNAYISGQLVLNKVESNRAYVTNEKIEKLKAQIKTEEEKIKKGKVEGETKIVQSTSFRIAKK